MNDNKEAKKKGNKYSTSILSLIVIVLGTFFLLLTLNIIPGIKTDFGAVLGLTIFCFALGIPGLIISITVRANENKRKKDLIEKGISEEDYIKVFKDNIPELKGKTMKRYVFKQVRSSIVKYKLFDDHNNLVYNSYRLNKTFFVPLKVSFNNHISNKSFLHIFGRTPVGYANKNKHFIPLTFAYKADGLTIDDYCATLNIQMHQTGFNQYDIKYKNVLIGRISWLVTQRLVANSRKIDPIKINCIEDYIDIVFFLCFAFGFSSKALSYSANPQHYERM